MMRPSSALLAALVVILGGCSAWVDAKLKNRADADATCTSNVDCDDMQPCNGLEMCNDGACLPGDNADNGSPCPLGSRSGVCNLGECVECIRDQDCDNDFVCDGRETCDLGTNTCIAGSLPPPMTPCMFAPLRPGTCVDGQCCNDVGMCCDAMTCMRDMR